MSAEQIDDGGSAFPWTEFDASGALYHQNPGMSLRDHFAGLALNGFAVGTNGMGDMPIAEVRQQFEKLADYCYLMADAMIRARQGAIDG